MNFISKTSIYFNHEKKLHKFSNGEQAKIWKLDTIKLKMGTSTPVKFNKYEIKSNLFKDLKELGYGTANVKGRSIQDRIKSEMKEVYMDIKQCEYAIRVAGSKIYIFVISYNHSGNNERQNYEGIILSFEIDVSGKRVKIEHFQEAFNQWHKFTTGKNNMVHKLNETDMVKKENRGKYERKLVKTPKLTVDATQEQIVAKINEIQEVTNHNAMVAEQERIEDMQRIYAEKKKEYETIQNLLVKATKQQGFAKEELANMEIDMLSMGLAQ